MIQPLRNLHYIEKLSYRSWVNSY